MGKVESLIDEILTAIEKAPMCPDEIAACVSGTKEETDYAIQLILDRGYAAPNLDWKLTLNLNF
ncbi:hypothetical protein KAR91_06770 [Candidatus Pacearchaeota archaeon]|nr:hypothetical protein [Candidatus Pacearchaeota archaeon]